MAARPKNIVLVVTLGDPYTNEVYEDLFFGPFSEGESVVAERRIGDRFDGGDVLAVRHSVLLPKTRMAAMARKK